MSTEKTPPKKTGFFGWLSVLIGLALSASFFAPTTTLIAIGMLPTFVMAIADPSPDRRGAMAIGVMNFAGVLPFLIMLWKQGHTQQNAIRILSDPMTLLVMLGAAGVASAIYIYVPKSVAMLASLRAQSEIAGRRALQKKLVQRWGDRVTSQKKLEELIGE